MQKNLRFLVTFERRQKWRHAVSEKTKRSLAELTIKKQQTDLKVISAVDSSNGMWLGPGLDGQSLLLSNSLTEEDKKYNFEGMAYIILNGNYTLIKTMMDGDD